MEYSHFHPANSFPAESEDFIFTSHGIYTYKLGGLPGHPGEGSHCTAWSWARDFTGLSQPELISKYLHRPVRYLLSSVPLMTDCINQIQYQRNKVNRINIYDNIWQRSCIGLAYTVLSSPNMAVCTLGRQKTSQLLSPQSWMSQQFLSGEEGLENSQWSAHL